MEESDRTKHFLLFTVAPFALISPAMAEDVAPKAPAAATDVEAEAPQNGKPEVFSTGVAKGRDRLDSATSTSALKGDDLITIGTRSVAEVLRNIPGIRVEGGDGDVNNNYTIRGLPLASNGSKYLQLQEDGLPVLEYGDMIAPADMFLRPDLNLAAVEAIRGGSASTFASNSPGGIINFISKTGDVEGGAVRASAGLNYGEQRLDFDYGHKLSDTLRFHVGGFYRTGEGPRDTGFTAYKGGQIKLNVTKEFGNGYIRLSGKYLDDRTPSYQPVPVHVSGSNADPGYEAIGGIHPSHDAILSPYVTNLLTLDGNNQAKRFDAQDGIHAIAKTIGLEAQFEVAGFTITNKFRYADLSGDMMFFQHGLVGSASSIAAMFGGAGATLSYATGPNAGQAITDLAGLNGNGLLAMTSLRNTHLQSVDNLTNDLRATRQWDIGGGVLTTTAGIYKSIQTIDNDWLFTTGLSDVRGEGQSALVNLTRADGVAMTQNGVLGYTGKLGAGTYRRKYDVDYDVLAPYGSLNFMIGQLAIGGSIRYDKGSARGSLFGSELGGGRVGLISYDINGDGTISVPEMQVATLPLDRPAPVNYDYDYVSYSVGVNWRIAEPLAVFGRYSKGGRGAADRVLFTPIVSTTTGDLLFDAGNDTVKQAEVGVKFRKDAFAVNLTAFWAKTTEVNSQTVVNPDGSLGVQIIARDYVAKGVEFEGSVRHGPFSLTAGATWTDAQIDGDILNPAIVGNTPRHQPDFIFQATPKFETEMFTIGANVIGTTESYTQDVNQLVLPGYTMVNVFAAVRPVEHVQLSLNVANLFDTVAYTDIAQPTLPASGLASARVLNPRTVMTALTFSF